MSKLRIQLLGGLQVYTGPDRPVAISARKAQALLAFLARHPDRPQPRGKLAALLWEDSGEMQQRGSLRQALALLRAALDPLGDELVRASADAVVLACDHIHIDAMEFERLVRLDTPQALEAAIALYDGEFLEAFNPKAPAFEDWLLAERQHLRERAVEAMSGLLRHYTASGLIERAIETALRLLSLDPLQESVHRSLMSLYARQGRQASALRQFQLSRELLRRELGVSPEPETERLFQEIREQRRRRMDPAGERPALMATAVAAETATTAEAPPPAEPERRPLSELRHVTAFCAEIADPADDAGVRDPEQIERRSERFVEIVRTIAEAHGGVVEVYVGGGAVAFFGAAVAHGNDAERAARASLRVRDAVAIAQGQETEGFGVRIGIADGTVLVTRGGKGNKPRIAGDVVNRAARLAADAAAGEILISDSLHQTLWRLLERTEERRLSSPGSASTRRTWRLADLHDRPATMAKLVGREAERQQFASILETCRERGRGLAVYLRGEAGIGKTRLVQEFCALARDVGFACHVGAVLDFGAGGSRDVIGTVVRGLLDLTNHTDDQAAIRKALEEASLPSRLEPYLYDLLRLPHPVETRSVYDAMDNAARERGRRETLIELLRLTSANRARLVVVEDLHWADPPTLAQAATLAAAVGDCPTVLVMTARPEGDPVNAAWRSMACDATLFTMDLSALHRQEALDLAAQYVDANAPFAIRCVERCGGNPLFLEQLLRAGEADESLPGSVQSVVMARMDRMEEEDRHALRAASVFGQRFSLNALRDLIGASNYECDRLLENGLVRPDGDDYLFVHALVREGAYASLPVSERHVLHRRVAASLTGRDPVLRAEHMDRADDPAAAQAYLEAARRQSAQYRYDRALRLVERGLALATATADRFALTCFRGEILHDLGEIPDARSAYEEAFALAADEAARCRSRLGLAAVKRISDDLDAALADIEEAEQAAERLGLVQEASRAHFLHGNVLFPRADLEGCLREHQRSLELAQEAGSAELEAAALGGLGDAEYMRGRMLSARARFHRCVELAREHGFGRIEVANRPMAAITLWYAGDVVGELHEALAAIEAAAKVGHPRAEMIAHMMAYAGHAWLLELDAALEHGERALRLARQINAPRFEAEALMLRGDVHRLADRQAEALVDIDAGLALSRRTGMAYMGPWYLGILAVATGDAATRSAALSEGEALVTSNSIGHNHLHFRAYAIDACLAAGDWDGAVRHAAALEAFAREEPLPFTDFYAARGRALAAHGQGKRDRTLISALQRLRNEGEQFGYRIAIPAIESALEASGI